MFRRSVSVYTQLEFLGCSMMILFEFVSVVVNLRNLRSLVKIWVVQYVVETQRTISVYFLNQ